MGSPASGNRRPSHLCTDQVVAVDVRALFRAGALRPGTAFTLSTGAAGCVARCLTLEDHAFEILTKGAALTHYQRVRLLRTPCHLGGARCWAACPCCERRVAILYLLQGSAVCRLCADMRYRSQREPGRDRQRRKLQGMRGLLQWEPCAWDPRGVKPAGMHWKTYAATVRRYLAIEADFRQAETIRLGLTSRMG